MILCGQQPNYLPWIGLFSKISLADRFAIVDHVQYVPKSVISRNLIRGPDGTPLRLTVPVRTAGRGRPSIADVEIDDARPWRRKHWRSIRAAYRKAPFFAEHAPFFEDLYSRPWRRLADLNVRIMLYLMDAFGLDVETRRTSSMEIRGAKTEMLVSLCRAFGCDTYLSGQGARKYVEEEVFRRAGIAHRHAPFRHPVYPQAGHEDFLPRLSALDLLVNCGPGAADIIRGAAV